MRRLLAALLLGFLMGCGPAFSPTLLSQCDDLMLPPQQGLNGPLPPSVGGAPSRVRQARWKGRLLLIRMPRSPMDRSVVHPAMKLLDDNLKAHSDEEVTSVGFVLEQAVSQAGVPGGSGYILVTVVDFKSRTNLGTWIIKEWKTYPEAQDFEQTYPALINKLKELHQAG